MSPHLGFSRGSPGESILLASKLFFALYAGAGEACLSCHIQDLGYRYCRKNLETGKGSKVWAED